MAVFMGAFPVLPGKEDEARKFAQETLDRIDEFEASERRFGVTKEEWSLQQTPMGSMVVVRFEADDVAGAFAGGFVLSQRSPHTLELAEAFYPARRWRNTRLASARCSCSPWA